MLKCHVFLSKITNFFFSNAENIKNTQKLKTKSFSRKTFLGSITKKSCTKIALSI